MPSENYWWCRIIIAIFTMHNYLIIKNYTLYQITKNKSFIIV